MHNYVTKKTRQVIMICRAFLFLYEVSPAGPTGETGGLSFESPPDKLCSLGCGGFDGDVHFGKVFYYLVDDILYFGR